jgi:hypothetical protein
MNVETLGHQRMFLMVEERMIIDKAQAFPSFSHSFLGSL